MRIVPESARRQTHDAEAASGSRRHLVAIVAAVLGLLALLGAQLGAGGAPRASHGVATSRCGGVPPSSGAVSTCDDGAVSARRDQAPEPAVGGVPGAGAMRIHRDPATGEFTAPPAGPEAAAGAAAGTSPALDSSGAHLVETPGTSAAGGVTMDLHGTFRSAITAAVTDDGRVTSRCAQTTDGR